MLRGLSGSATLLARSAMGGLGGSGGSRVSSSCVEVKEPGIHTIGVDSCCGRFSESVERQQHTRDLIDQTGAAGR